MHCSTTQKVFVIYPNSQPCPPRPSTHIPEDSYATSSSLLVENKYDYCMYEDYDLTQMALLPQLQFKLSFLRSVSPTVVGVE